MSSFSSLITHHSRQSFWVLTGLKWTGLLIFNKSYSLQLIQWLNLVISKRTYFCRKTKSFRSTFYVRGPERKQQIYRRLEILILCAGGRRHHSMQSCKLLTFSYLRQSVVDHLLRSPCTKAQKNDLYIGLLGSFCNYSRHIGSWKCFLSSNQK